MKLETGKRHRPQRVTIPWMLRMYWWITIRASERSTMKTKGKTWTRLLAHVKETTVDCTLREVKSNIESQRSAGIVCNECLAIAAKLGLK